MGAAGRRRVAPLRVHRCPQVKLTKNDAVKMNFFKMGLWDGFPKFGMYKMKKV